MTCQGYEEGLVAQGGLVLDSAGLARKVVGE